MPFNLITLSPDTLADVPDQQARPIRSVVRIEADGGSECNIPRLGYGRGYGSFRIGDGKIFRLHFQECMSANCAELLTLATAITVAKQQGWQHVLCVSDSRIALKWADTAAGNRKATKIQNCSAGFQDAVRVLYEACFGLVSLPRNGNLEQLASARLDIDRGWTVRGLRLRIALLSSRWRWQPPKVACDGGLNGIPPLPRSL